MTRNLSDAPEALLVLDESPTGRRVAVHEIRDAQVIGDLYPDVTVYSGLDSCVYRVIEERVMSLPGVEAAQAGRARPADRAVSHPVFFFLYNTDNYYHFVYDSLPYILSYKMLREVIPGLRLLMSWPNPGRRSMYPFVTEMLAMLDISEGDIEMASQGVRYERMFVSGSFTHGRDSDMPPPAAVSGIYRSISERAMSVAGESIARFPRKIYVSRRTWTHNDLSNIGTNYTTRRRLVVEDELVGLLRGLGYEEVFTERLSTEDKVVMFCGAEKVVGAIGGGSCNVLFSPPSTRHLCIVSPTFLDVNARFRHCLSGVATEYFTDTWHVEDSPWKRHMRVKCGDLVGEIEEVSGGRLLVSHTDAPVAGWNSELSLARTWVDADSCRALDGGLNSAWALDLEKIKDTITKL
jgi:capsular polysaccharide biosynthesis protein